jgi:hypothetical protein
MSIEETSGPQEAVFLDPPGPRAAIPEIFPIGCGPVPTVEIMRDGKRERINQSDYDAARDGEILG